MRLHRQLILIALSVSISLSLSLSLYVCRIVYCGQMVQDRPIVYIEVE